MSIMAVNIDDPFLRSVIAELHNETLVRSVVTIAPDLLPDELKSGAIDSKFLYVAEQVKRAFPGQGPAAVSRDVLHHLLDCERQFLITSDRTNHKPTSVKERKRLFRELVRYFRGYLMERQDIATVFFESTPHMGWDLVLYHVARLEKRKTLILTRTLLADCALLLDRFDTAPALVANPPAIDTAILMAAGQPSPWSSASTARNINALSHLKKKSIWRRGLATWFTLVKLLRGSPLQPQFVSATAGTGSITPLAVAYQRYRHSIWAAALKKAYDDRVRPVPAGPYVFFAMHFQPERTTQPEGLEFEDQFLALAIISRSLPDGWSVVVKEHPRQFELSPLPLRLRHARTPSDYQEIAELKNVVFAPLEMSTGELISNASATATITGSAGWEAINAGKPAFVFGPCWYAGCDAVALIDSEEAFQRGFKMLLGKSPDDIKADLEMFVRRLAPSLIRTTTADAYARKSSMSYKDLVNNLARAITSRTKMEIA